MVSMPLFTGFLIENQVVEANANRQAASAATTNVEQALTQQVTNAYLDTLTFAQQIAPAEEQVKTAQEALQLEAAIQARLWGRWWKSPIRGSTHGGTNTISGNAVRLQDCGGHPAYTSQGDDTGRILLMSRAANAPRVPEGVSRVEGPPSTAN